MYVQHRSLIRISVVVPTRYRPKDLADLLRTLHTQSYPPIEVIVVDDSSKHNVKEVVKSFNSLFHSVGCELKYVRGHGDGLPAARNLGVKISQGDAVLFLDDDTLLDRNVVRDLAAFLTDNSVALGVQPKILPSKKHLRNETIAKKFKNAVSKALMLTYHKDNKLAVRRSGTSVFPNHLTRILCAERLSGCSCCYKSEIFTELSFDTNLKRWAFLEDLDFSYRVHKTHPRALYVLPHTKIIHKASEDGGLSVRTTICMMTIYRFYVFFKEVFDGSLLNLIAFLWAIIGSLVTTVGEIIFERKSNREMWIVIYLLSSYATAFRNLKNIFLQKLEFFNKEFQE